MNMFLLLHNPRILKVYLKYTWSILEVHLEYTLKKQTSKIKVYLKYTSRILQVYFKYTPSILPTSILEVLGFYLQMSKCILDKSILQVYFKYTSSILQVYFDEAYICSFAYKILILQVYLKYTLSILGKSAWSILQVYFKVYAKYTSSISLFRKGKCGKLCIFSILSSKRGITPKKN